VSRRVAEPTVLTRLLALGFDRADRELVQRLAALEDESLAHVFE